MIEITAPAKLNLGLEILGRREDGYHEIRTVMTPVSLADTLTLTRSGGGRLTLTGLPTPVDGNIVSEAMSLLSTAWGVAPVDARLEKRIPLASGLGGGSSDAAATLLGMSRLFDRETPALLDHAAQLGSDVPFFLTNATALVSGRGEIVSPLNDASPVTAVIVVPRVTIPRKTATLYAALRPSDFSDGSSMDSIVDGLATITSRDSALPNAFRRALYDLVPALSTLSRSIERIAARPANVTGAGPAHYVLCQDAEDAAKIDDALRAGFGTDDVSIHVVSTLTGAHIREVADVR